MYMHDMNMETLLWTAIVILFFMIKFAKSDIKELKEKVDKLTAGEPIKISPTPENASIIKEVPPVKIEEPTPPVAVTKETTYSEPIIKEKVLTKPTIKETGTDLNFFGQNLITWIAGFAAILGAFYFVKYSIDNGILGPQARMAIAAILGFVLVGSGIMLWSKKELANNERISQALIGVGISTLYFVSYAISKIYGFVPVGTSFVLMCIVTASTVVITLKIGGMPIAILGLIGGFLTPALVSTGNSGVVSFSGYLFVLAFAFLLIARKFASALLIIMSLFAIYGWIFIWMFIRYSTYDSGWFMALTITITALVCVLFPASQKTEWKQIQNCAIGATIFLGFCFLIKTSFGLFEWGIICLMLAGLVVLCLFKPKDYLKILSSTFGFAYLLFFYGHSMRYKNSLSAMEAQLIYLGMSLIGFLPFYIRQWFKNNRNLLYFISAFVPVVFGLYYIIFDNHEIYPYIGMGLFVLINLLIFNFNLNQEAEQQDAGITLLSATSILTMALASYLDTSFWPIVLATEIMVLGLIKSFTLIKKLDFGIWTLLSIFAINQAKTIINTLKLLLSEQFDDLKFKAADMNTEFFVACILIPVTAFAILALFSKDKFIKGIFSGLSGALGFFGAFSFYMLVRMKFEGTASAIPTFGEHAVITNALFVISLGAIFFKDNKAFCVAWGLGLWRVVAMNLISMSPLSHQIDISMGNIISAYGIPMLTMGILAYFSKDNIKPFFSWVAAFFSFALVSFIILKANYGTLHLDYIDHTNTGIFILSMGWLVLGCIWLAFAFKNKSLVLPAFGLIYFVIAKVFLYDVSSLDGIYRVMALFGLAGSLLGISHFYAKYFQTPKAKV